MTRLLKSIAICILTVGLALGSMSAMGFDASPYHLIFGEARWQTKVNNFMDAVSAQITSLGNAILNWSSTVDSLTLIETTPAYSDASTFLLAADYSTRLTPGKRLVADCGADGLLPNTVVSCTYAAPNSTVVVTTANLTANLAAVSYYATRNGVNTYGSGDVVAAEYGVPSWANLQSAVAVANASGRRLLLTPGDWPVSDDLGITALVHPVPGARFVIATTKTLTISGGLDAGLYQVFSCAGTGAVAGLKSVFPEWFGAVGNSAIDDTDALDQAVAACDVNGVIRLGLKSYVTTGLLVSKTISIVSDSPLTYTVAGATLKAAGAQAYVLKFQGTNVTPATTFLHPYMMGINIDADDQAISDAAFIMEYCHLAWVERCSFQNAVGHGVRLRACWETYFNNFIIHKCGTLDTGSAFFIDGVTPLDYAYICSNVHLTNGTWSSNKGRWLDISSLAGIDGLWFQNNKLELDDITILNTVNTNVLHIGAMSRGSIKDNKFAIFGASYGKYANLIWLGGINDDGRAGAPGGPGSEISGNQYIGLAGSGAINGLSLAANAPPVREHDNVYITDAVVVSTCPNVNVATHQQYITKMWNSFHTTFTRFGPSNQEVPGFISVHDLYHGADSTLPFAADANCVNNASTVLSLAAANQANGDICSIFNIGNYIGHSDTNLVVRLRMRLSAAGNVTLYSNPSGIGTWSGIPGIVNSQTWEWYEFIHPISVITTADHLLNVYNWVVNTGTPALLVDGMMLGTNNVGTITVTTGSPAISIGSHEYIVYLNSVGGAITATLANGTMIGQRVTIRMIEATTSSTVTVATHVTSTPEVFTFATLGATLTLQWNGAAWATISNHGATL